MTKMVAEIPVGINIARKDKSGILKRIREANAEAERTGKLVTLVNIDITPELANDILSVNAANRPQSIKKVNDYAAVMKAGNWEDNGDPIRIRKDMVLADGQHKLGAIVESGLTFTYNIVCGLKKSAMATIDLQKRRTAADLIYMDGIYKANPNVLAAAINLHLLISVGRIAGKVSADMVSTQNVEDFLKNDTKKKQMIACVSEALSRLHNEGRFLTASQWGALYYTLLKRNEFEAKLFIEGLATNDGISSTDPKNSAIYHLRKMLLDLMPNYKGSEVIRANSHDVLFKKFKLIIKGWNAFLRGMRVTAKDIELTKDDLANAFLPLIGK